MRSIGLPLVLATMAAAIGCASDRALAPTPGPPGLLVPPELIAAYTEITLPGRGFVTALNDSGDVVGDFSGGILWHGAAHEMISIPIHPRAIANDGTVLGVIHGHPATWKNGRVTILDTAASVAFAICKCESATVIGDVMVNGVSHPAIWVDGIRIDAGLPPNSFAAAFVAIGGGFVVGNASFRVPNPNPGTPGDSVEFVEPYSWSPAGGWARLRHGPLSDAFISAMNSHGIAVGGTFGTPNPRVIYFDLGAGTGEQQVPLDPFFPDMRATGINDSGRISGLGDFFNSDGITNGNQVALVGSLSTGVVAALPPGLTDDASIVGINNAGVIAGNNPTLPVLWIPNP